jgi:hypothetical protein
VFNKKRLIISLITGSILGVVCIIGAQLRSGFEREAVYLFSFWFNRLLLGMVIGVLSSISLKKALLRGLLVGLIISFSFYSATGFDDLIGFIAGIVYGIIIEYVAFILTTKKKQ